MANKEHLAILKQGVETWNRWREENPEIVPDLKGANLKGAYLCGADLSNANLSSANLSSANLSVANLSDANLFDAYFSGSDLSYANLSKANLEKSRFNNLNYIEIQRMRLFFTIFALFMPVFFLVMAHISGIEASKNGGSLNRGLPNTIQSIASIYNIQPLYLHIIFALFICLFLLICEEIYFFIEISRKGANLSFADLSKANLYGANLSFTNLSSTRLEETIFDHTSLNETNFFKARLNNTFFISVKLHNAKYLISTINENLSHINKSTIFMSKGKIPNKFLKACIIHEKLRAPKSDTKHPGVEEQLEKSSYQSTSSTEIKNEDLVCNDQYITSEMQVITINPSLHQAEIPDSSQTNIKQNDSIDDVPIVNNQNIKTTIHSKPINLSLTQEEIDDQFELLKTYRAHLKELLKIGIGRVEPHITLGIKNYRREIAERKAYLREHGVEVSDHYDDIER
jgi:uncharacterized protein YjbI with pentapeptide repeats